MGLHNGLAPNRRQAIILNQCELDSLTKMCGIRGDELTFLARSKEFPLVTIKLNEENVFTKMKFENTNGESACL